MSARTILRVISSIMLIIAVAFLLFVLSHPESGTVFYIGGVAICADIWCVFYAVYAVVMVGLFVCSFFVKRPPGKRTFVEYWREKALERRMKNAPEIQFRIRGESPEEIEKSVIKRNFYLRQMGYYPPDKKHKYWWKPTEDDK